MPIVAEGQLNLTAQVVPNVAVVIVPPKVQLITGVPTDVVGVVGTAVWGPVGTPMPAGDYAGYVRTFGPLQARTFDMGTIVAPAHQQGATNFRCVRVTDGTDTAATINVLTNCVTYTSRYSGSLGNSIKVMHAAGSRPGTWRVTVFLPDAGFLPEVFDNIGEGLSGNALWQAIAAAVNNGQFGIRSASEIVIATAGAGTTAPVEATYQLAGGTDGVAGVTAATLVGQDTAPRKGMYALRGAGCGAAALADCDDTTTWPAQVSYGISEGTYMLLVGQKGQTVSDAVAAKRSAGIDDWEGKVLLGDWVYWLDTTNGQPERLISPQGIALGRYATLSPEQSGLNKPVYDVVATQRTKLNRPYSDADLTMLGQAGIDVITNPVPGGSYFGLRFGRNSSSNPVVRGDNYTRLTNYIAASLDKGMGIFVGRLNSAETRRQCKVTLDAFFSAMFDQGMIEAWRVVCDESNNPENRRALGYLQADVQVRYLGVVENLIVNLEGGQSVQITRRSSVPVAA